MEGLVGCGRWEASNALSLHVLEVWSGGVVEGGGEPPDAIPRTFCVPTSTGRELGLDPYTYLLAQFRNWM